MQGSYVLALGSWASVWDEGHTHLMGARMATFAAAKSASVMMPPVTLDKRNHCSAADPMCQGRVSNELCTREHSKCNPSCYTFEKTNNVINIPNRQLALGQHRLANLNKTQVLGALPNCIARTCCLYIRHQLRSKAPNIEDIRALVRNCRFMEMTKVKTLLKE